MGYEIPPRFFMDLDQVDLPVKDNLGMKWYDHIIDDLLANPGTSLADTARRLGRSPSTVYTVCASDLFKARYSQRRAQFEEELSRKMVAKITRAADLALDATIEVLEKKRDAIPLPVLNEVTKNTLDRLGYGPSREPPVVINNNVVSAEALAAAREKLRTVEGSVKTVAGPTDPDGED